MIEAKTEKTVLELGLLAVLSFCLILVFPKHQPLKGIDFSFPITRQEIAQRSDSFLSSQGIDSRSLMKSFKLQSDAKHIVYVQRTAGTALANHLLKKTVLYYWEVSYWNNSLVGSIINKSPPLYKVRVHPISGSIVGFQQLLPAAENKKPASLNQALSQAEKFISSLGFVIGQDMENKWAEVNNGYQIEFEHQLFPEFHISEKISLAILSDKVADFRFSLVIPQERLQRYVRAEQEARWWSLSLTFIVYALTLWAFLIGLTRQRSIVWRRGLVFAVLMLIASCSRFLKISDYLHTQWFSLFLGATIFDMLVAFGITFIVANVMYYCADKSGVSLQRLPVPTAITLSYIFVFTGLGLTILFSFLIFHFFNPVSTLGFYKLFAVFPDSAFLCLLPPLLSLTAAVAEEVFFRGFLISLLKRFIRNTAFVVVLSTLLWAFAHLTAMEYSDVFPFYLKGFFVLPIGFLLAFIFVRFGLAAAIATHYLYDLFVMSVAFGGFIQYSSMNISVAVFVGAAAMPLAVALWVRRVKHA